MFSFLDRFRSRRFLAVDLDGRSLRVVQAEKAGEQARILKLAGADAPEGLDQGDPRQVGAFLAATLKEMHLTGESLVMSVSRGQAVLKTLSLPAGIAGGELAGMVRYQVEKELPFRPEEAAIDFSIESHYDASGSAAESGATSVLVAAVRLPVVDHYRRLAEGAGAKLQRLGLRPYANMRCLQACGLLGERRRAALVHVRTDETEIDVFAGESLAFSRSAVVRIPTSQDPAAQSAESVQGVVMEVARSLQSYQAVQGSGKIEALYVAGGTGIEPQAAQELQRRLGVPCQVLNPSGPLGIVDDGRSGAFLAALGMAIANCAGGEMPFDFLSPKKPSARRNAKKIRAVAATAAAATVLLAGVVCGATALAREQAKIDKLNGDISRAKNEKKKVDALAEKVRAAEKWVQAGHNWLDHLANLSRLFPPAEDAYIITPSLRANNDGTMVFTVRAKNDGVIADLGRRLDEAGYGFKRGRTGKVADPLGYIFDADVQVQVRPKVVISSTQPGRPGDDATADPNFKIQRGRGGKPRDATPPKDTPAPKIENLKPAENPPEAKPSEKPTPSPAGKPPRKKRDGQPVDPRIQQ